MILLPQTLVIFVLRWAWLNFKTLNLDEMKLKFMTQGQASKDQQRLKEKIQKKKYKLQKEEKLKKKKRKKR